MKTKRLNVNALFLRNSTTAIVFLDLVVQLVLVGKHLDNSIISPYAPTASDAADYAGRAQVWQSHGFSHAFSDAYRMPGYPLIILLMRLLVPSAPYLAVRVLQLVAVAISVGVIKIVLERFVTKWIAIVVSCAYMLLPIWHFVPILLAESLTSVIVVAMIYILGSISNLGITRKQILEISFLIAIGTYLKPNNLLLVIVVFGFLLFRLKSQVIRSISTILLFVLFLLSPWIYFSSHAQPGFIGLTTNSGGNLYTGTGMVISYDQSVLATSAIKWKVDPRNNAEDVVVITPDLTLVNQNSMLTTKSIQIWKKRPLSEIGYGFDKILIAFGILSNSLVDHLFGLISLLSLLSGLMLLKSREYRAWGVAILLVSSLLAIQAADFQADRRFVVPVLFPFFVVCIGLALGNLLPKGMKRNE